MALLYACASIHLSWLVSSRSTKLHIITGFRKVTFINRYRPNGSNKFNTKGSSDGSEGGGGGGLTPSDVFFLLVSI